MSRLFATLLVHLANNTLQLYCFTIEQTLHLLCFLHSLVCHHLKSGEVSRLTNMTLANSVDGFASEILLHDIGASGIVDRHTSGVQRR